MGDRLKRKKMNWHVGEYVLKIINKIQVSLGSENNDCTNIYV